MGHACTVVVAYESFSRNLTHDDYPGRRWHGHTVVRADWTVVGTQPRVRCAYRRCAAAFLLDSSYSIHRRGLLPHTFRAYTSSHFRCPATTGRRSSDIINCGMSESRSGFSQSSPGIDDSMDDGDFAKEPDCTYNACRHYSTP